MSQKAGETMAKTVKYWVFVREDGMPRQVCVEIPSSTELVPEAGRWVEMTGELPAPEPEQPEGTCSIRWDDGSWKAYDSSERVHWFGTDLTNALDKMRSLRFRVLNDPREVWLEQSGWRAWRIRTLEGFQEKTLRTGSGTLLQHDLAKQECSLKGWRILREEPLKEQPASGPGPDRELTLLDGTVYRKVGSNGMNAYEELDRMQRELTRTRDLLTEAIKERDDAWDRLRSRRAESRTPV
jgi:hypothetical protein